MGEKPQDSHLTLYLLIYIYLIYVYDMWLEPPRSQESINVTIRKIRYDLMQWRSFSWNLLTCQKSGVKLDCEPV